MSELLLQASGLAITRGDETLVTDLDLTLHGGQLLLIRGPNGVGKTSLLRCLVGLHRPERGSVRWRGSCLDSPGGAARLSRELAYVGHASAVKLDLSPVENLQFVAALSGRSSGASIDEALIEVGLARRAGTPARRLSMGQKRRLALATLLVSPATLWVLDEPVTGLDDDGVNLSSRLLIQHASHGGAAILTSHQPIALGAYGRELLLP